MTSKTNSGQTLMVLNRNFTHASTLGHAVRFVKDKATLVPNPLVREIIALGGVRADGEDGVAAPVKKVDATPTNPADRLDAVSEAIEKVVAENTRSNFTGTGMPKVGAVTNEAGFRVDKTELNKAWQLRADEKLAEKENAAS